MNLSLQNCGENSALSSPSLWEQLNTATPNPPQPVLHGHDALTTVFEDTEWMVVTGGFAKPPKDDFNVWLLNLTHADIYDEEVWTVMNSTSTATSCPSFNVTDDIWDHTNLWDFAVECAPSSRQNHLSTMVNDYLYIFGGHSDDFDFDPHVYRIPLSSVVVENDTTAWRRILPRNTRDKAIARNAALRGGLWRKSPHELPKLIAFSNPTKRFDSFASSNPYTALAALTERQHQPNQIWQYDFTEDTWDIFMTTRNFDYTNGDYTAMIIRDNLVIVGTDGCSGATFNSVNLRTLKTQENVWRLDLHHVLPNQTFVAYPDSADPDTTILAAFGPKMRHKNSALGISQLRFKSGGAVNGDMLQIENQPKIQPHSRTGHTTVLSTRGFMYVFGGVFEQTEFAYREAVWRINVGGAGLCGLRTYEVYDYGVEDDLMYPNDDFYATSDTSGGGAFILLPFILAMAFMLKTSQRIPQQRAPEGPRGLTPEQLDAFPTRVLCAEDQADECHDCSEEAKECSICLLDYSDGDEIRDLACKHFFHKECVDNWLQSETTCPLCRVSLRPEPLATDGEPEIVPPPRNFFRFVTALFQRDEREPHSNATTPTSNTTNESSFNDDDGLELASVYSLELQEEDNISVISGVSILSQNSILAVPTGESTNERRRRRRRHRRTGRGQEDDERTTPLTAASADAVMA